MKTIQIRSLIVTGVLAFSLTFGAAVVPSYAQAQSGETGDEEMGTQMPMNQAEEDGTDWGWIGLLGLAGLAGLRGRKKDHDHVDRTRP